MVVPIFQNSKNRWEETTVRPKAILFFCLYRIILLTERTKPMKFPVMNNETGMNLSK